MDALQLAMVPKVLQAAAAQPCPVGTKAKSARNTPCHPVCTPIVDRLNQGPLVTLAWITVPNGVITFLHDAPPNDSHFSYLAKPCVSYLLFSSVKQHTGRIFIGATMLR